MPTPEEELQRSLRLSGGIKRLGRLQGIDSIGTSLDWEAEAIKKQADMDFANINGTDFSSAAAQDEGDMKKTLIAGDVHNHNYYSTNGTPPKSEEPTPVAQAAPAPVAAKSTGARVTKAELEKYIAKKAAQAVAAAQPAAVPATVLNWKQYVWPALAAMGFGTGIYNALPESPAPPVAPETPAVIAPSDARYQFEISSDKGKGFTSEAPQ